MKVTVIGTGYVGLVTGACLANLGHQVICADISVEKITTLTSGELPIWEMGLDGLLKEARRSERIRYTTNMDFAIEEAEVLLIAVGTPSQPDGDADLSHLWSVVHDLAAYNLTNKLLIIKSTVPVGTTDAIDVFLHQLSSDHHPIDVVHNPEFLRQGNAVHDFFHPDRIVVGCASETARNIMRTLYNGVSAPFHFCNRSSAELIKYASNVFLAMKISYINMIADLAENLGANIEDVAKGMGLDKRIGASFLQAGAGYGGSCFPKDIKALKTLGQKWECELPLLDSIEAINNERPRAIVNKAKKYLGSLIGKKIALFGLTFKPMTDDIREASSLAVSQLCIAEGADVHVYDPLVHTYPVQGVTVHRDMYLAADSCDSLIILTEWEEFRDLDWSIISKALRFPLIIDGRNMFSWEYMRQHAKEHHLIYLSIGRPPM
ncbi:UDP-glucose/GDP-mannose dehydrogenase family protein [Aneurinibacillus sp. Ricciae_BoGa-3]|uniref:UDP-glucose dehydrogenase family protein n=1 Tax=Aneurinibacillus sp. Ricciae_BoGa-3 TaxID=3022697 RepID=UPI00234285AD|nr:UDP-glucose/GDP-mannose dehydrogenase family protein [Aneurinibacillus sp. Ricciae_BoGa-3]WCK54029.1 UDP-glucose/GDP-mannose dehydrogenase family protein [Aneurinibacillus sp. Ricciae_BoGa-3]